MIVLLTSGVTLGTHVPAVVLARRLTRAGIPARVEVFERLLREAERERVVAAKPAFRADFAVAVTAQRLARDQSPSLDDAAVASLLASWQADGVDTVVIFSGFWVPVVEQYQARHRSVRVDVCHCDAAASRSFTIFADRMAQFQHVWLVREAGDEPLPCSIPVGDRPPVPWAQRTSRLLCHGGGWGLGTYQSRASELATRGFALDLIAYHTDDLADPFPDARYFLLDPQWAPWMDDGFPPLGQMRNGQPVYERGTDHHGSYHLARQSLAMVCKPGAGSLLDSLWSATPIVLLEPFGRHEEANARLWQRLGFGISFDDWRGRGFPVSQLVTMHRKLWQAQAGLPDYTDDLIRAAAASR